jgi:hypothetical protein
MVYHYNKPARKWSVHFRGVCHVVDHFECHVPTEGHTQKTQPHRIARGWARSVDIVNQKAIIS